MTEVDEHASAEIPGTTGVPASLLAAVTALGTIDAVLRQACTPDGPEPADAVPERADALDALLLLRDVKVGGLQHGSRPSSRSPARPEPAGPRSPSRSVSPAAGRRAPLPAAAYGAAGHHR